MITRTRHLHYHYLSPCTTVALSWKGIHNLEMNAAILMSRKTLMTRVIRSRAILAPTRLLASTSTSTSPKSEESSARGSAWAAAAAAAVGVLGGSLALTLCDQGQHTRLNKSDVKDPMTIYAHYAMKSEMAEETPALQATSAATAKETTAKEKAAVPVEQATPVETMTESEARIEEATRRAKQHSGGLKIFSGNGNMSLALEITRHLGVNLGKATVGRFADGEVNVVVQENVRGKDVYVVQPTGPPVNDNIMELLLMVSTLRRASARRITVVIPYYGYARQDRKMQARVPISAADVARLMESMGVDRVIAVDLHCGQIQGFFGPRVPVDNLDGGIVGLDYFGCKDMHNPVIVSPDAGGVYRAKKFKEGLEQKYEMKDLGLAMIVKQRARAGIIDQMDLVGDVKDCDCILVDDMIDTAGTLCKAADVLIANGARRVFAFASHGLLSGPGNERIANSKMEEVVILNTIPTTPQREANEKLTELSVAPLLAQAIFNIHAKKSISALFK